jgi:hypothetical protein
VLPNFYAYLFDSHSNSSHPVLLKIIPCVKIMVTRGWENRRKGSREGWIKSCVLIVWWKNKLWCSMVYHGKDNYNYIFQKRKEEFKSTHNKEMVKFQVINMLLIMSWSLLMYAWIKTLHCTSWICKIIIDKWERKS